MDKKEARKDEIRKLVAEINAIADVGRACGSLSMYHINMLINAYLRSLEKYSNET